MGAAVSASLGYFVVARISAAQDAKWARSAAASPPRTWRDVRIGSRRSVGLQRGPSHRQPAAQRRVPILNRGLRPADEDRESMSPQRSRVAALTLLCALAIASRADAIGAPAPDEPDRAR